MDLPEPQRGLEPIAGAVAVMVAQVDRCTVNREQVVPQPDGFYGSWITSRVVRSREFRARWAGNGFPLSVCVDPRQDSSRLLARSVAIDHHVSALAPGTVPGGHRKTSLGLFVTLLPWPGQRQRHCPARA